MDRKMRRTLELKSKRKRTLEGSARRQYLVKWRLCHKEEEQKHNVI
jgi:hypothetical protein